MGYAPKFSMDEFKNWLGKQGDVNDFFELNEEKEHPFQKFVGHSARAKVSKNKLLEKISASSGDDHELIQELRSNGGTIVGINEENLCIETESGSFELPRFCVKVLKDS